MKIIDDTLLTLVADEAKKSPRLRMNYNFHQSLQDKCQKPYMCSPFVSCAFGSRLVSQKAAM